MARQWNEVRKDLTDSGLDEQRVQTAKSRMRDQVRAHCLADIRKAQKLSQQSVADRMRVSQKRVSALENGELLTAELGTIVAYVKALGGNLRVVADFGENTMTIADAATIAR